jgi:hypothetical protein
MGAREGTGARGDPEPPLSQLSLVDGTRAYVRITRARCCVAVPLTCCAVRLAALRATSQGIGGLTLCVLLQVPCVLVLSRVTRWAPSASFRFNRCTYAGTVHSYRGITNAVVRQIPRTAGAKRIAAIPRGVPIVAAIACSLHQVLVETHRRPVDGARPDDVAWIPAAVLAAWCDGGRSTSHLLYIRHGQ